MSNILEDIQKEIEVLRATKKPRSETPIALEDYGGLTVFYRAGREYKDEDTGQIEKTPDFTHLVFQAREGKEFSEIEKIPGVGYILSSQIKKYFIPSHRLDIHLNPNRYAFKPHDDLLLKYQEGVIQDKYDLVDQTSTCIYIPLDSELMEKVKTLYNEKQINFKVVSWFLSEFRNGGFGQFLHNSTGDLGVYLEKASKEISLPSVQSLIEEVKKVLNIQVLPATTKDRIDLVDEMEEDAWNALDELSEKYWESVNHDVLLEPLYNYIANNLKDFYVI